SRASTPTTSTRSVRAASAESPQEAEWRRRLLRTSRVRRCPPPPEWERSGPPPSEAYRQLPAYPSPDRAAHPTAAHRDGPKPRAVPKRRRPLKCLQLPVVRKRRRRTQPLRTSGIEVA